MPFLICKPYPLGALVAKMRDPMSGLIHLVASAFAIAGLVWLVLLAAGRSASHVTAFAIFGASMVLLYLASSVYHLSPVSERLAAQLRRLDHSMIYVFIAGSYTPIALVALGGTTGIALLVVVWTLALAGVFLKLVRIESSRWSRIGLYLLLGWLAVIVSPALVRALPASGLAWLAGGGAAYTVGSVVYALKRPDPLPRIVGFHEIWHVFVIAGSACHFFLMKDCILLL